MGVCRCALSFSTSRRVKYFVGRYLAIFESISTSRDTFIMCQKKYHSTRSCCNGSLRRCRGLMNEYPWSPATLICVINASYYAQFKSFMILCLVGIYASLSMKHGDCKSCLALFSVSSHLCPSIYHSSLFSVFCTYMWGMPRG
mgnify:CR=1 FL=1